jgi:hypothetical protein
VVHACNPRTHSTQEAEAEGSQARAP